MVDNVSKGRWTTEEKQRFHTARAQGFNWYDTALFIGTRTPEQCRTHDQKLKLKQNRRKVPGGSIL